MAEWRSELRSVFLKDPNVVVCRDIPSPEVMDDTDTDDTGGSSVVGTLYSLFAWAVE